MKDARPNFDNIAEADSPTKVMERNSQIVCSFWLFCSLEQTVLERMFHKRLHSNLSNFLADPARSGKWIWNKIRKFLKIREQLFEEFSYFNKKFSTVFWVFSSLFELQNFMALING